MTSPIGEDDDAYEQTQPAEMRRAGWSVVCTVCGDASFNGTVPIFPSRAAMWCVLESGRYGWTRRDDGRVLCRVHSAVADCDRDGHLVMRWQPHAIDSALRWRFCRRCGAQFDQQVVQ